jgi:hypothetical protein
MANGTILDAAVNGYFAIESIIDRKVVTFTYEDGWYSPDDPALRAFYARRNQAA